MQPAELAEPAPPERAERAVGTGGASAPRPRGARPASAPTLVVETTACKQRYGQQGAEARTDPAPPTDPAEPAEARTDPAQPAERAPPADRADAPAPREGGRHTGAARRVHPRGAGATGAPRLAAESRAGGRYARARPSNSLLGAQSPEPSAQSPAPRAQSPAPGARARSPDPRRPRCRSAPARSRAGAPRRCPRTCGPTQGSPCGASPGSRR